MHPDPAERERLATLTNFGISWVLPAQQWRWQSVKNNQRVLPWVPLN